MAGALGLRLAGPRSYGGILVDDGWMGRGRAEAKPSDILAALRQLYDWEMALMKEFNDQQLSERVTSMPFMGPTTSRTRVAYFSISHAQDIYGQLAVYLRLKGVTPPRSNRP